MLIGLAHGSRHARVADGIEAVLSATSLLAGVETRAAYLDLTDPDLEAVAADLAATGVRRAVVVPLLFTDAFHARIDVPEAVAQAADSSGIELVLAPILGTGDDVVAVVADRLSAAGTTAAEPILLYAVGSSRPDANAAVADLADRLAVQTRYAGPRRLRHHRAARRRRAGRADGCLRAAPTDAGHRRPAVRRPRAAAGRHRARRRGGGLAAGGSAGHPAGAGGVAAVPRGTGYRGPPPLALGHGEAPPMTITADHAGRRYPPTPAYEVSAAKIAEFARALGDDSPAYAGEQPIAPPTFVAVISSAAWESMFDDPELGSGPAPDRARRPAVHLPASAAGR